MNMDGKFWKLRLFGMAALLAGMVTATAPLVFAQNGVNPELQSQVASKLSHDPLLKGQSIMVNTDGGQVTLSGTVQNEKQWQEAETDAANVTGVRTILNNLTVAGQNSQPENNASEDQSGQMAPPPPPDTEQPQAPPAPASPANATGNDGNPPPPPPDQQDEQNSQAYGQQARPEYQGQGYGAGYGSQNYQGNNEYGNPGQYGGPAEQASGPVPIAAGTLLQIRTVEPLDSARLKDGQEFDATVARDVWYGNVLAIPRGATLQGVVVEAKQPKGKLGGKPRLELQITSLHLGGRAYPLKSDVWTSVGPDKAGYTVGNAATGGLLGAVIGGIIGRGPGAAVGAGLGAMAGLGASSATKGPRIYIPSEAVLNFHLAEPVTVQPVSWQEAQRLESSVPELQTRPLYGRPYPPPYYRPYPYYGPAVYYGAGW